MDDTRMSLKLPGSDVMTREDISKAADEEIDTFNDFMKNDLKTVGLIPPERAIVKTFIMAKLGVKMTK